MAENLFNTINSLLEVGEGRLVNETVMSITLSSYNKFMAYLHHQ